MNESSQPQRLRGKNVIVIGASRGLGRTIVAAAYAQGARVLAVARQEAELARLTEELSGVQVLALDATSESAPAKVFATLSPDVLLVCAGAIPHMAPLSEQSWEQFSRNWTTDVKLSLLFCQAALNTPLPEGSTIILMSSGAAIDGSPLSGGYAGAKRTLMFLASYAQFESDHRSLGLRFLALLPGGNILAETELGKVAASAYAAVRDVSVQDFIRSQRGQHPQVTTELVAKAVIKLASQPQGGEGQSFLITGAGVTPVS
jgi:NAD(P)-dependent dehydrogenase (short-subunit alcohol dehydrogenase family)